MHGRIYVLNVKNNDNLEDFIWNALQNKVDYVQPCDTYEEDISYLKENFVCFNFIKNNKFYVDADKLNLFLSQYRVATMEKLVAQKTPEQFLRQLLTLHNDYAEDIYFFDGEDVYNELEFLAYHNPNTIYKITTTLDFHY